MPTMHSLIKFMLRLSMAAAILLIIVLILGGINTSITSLFGSTIATIILLPIAIGAMVLFEKIYDTTRWG